MLASMRKSSSAWQAAALAALLALPASPAAAAAAAEQGYPTTETVDYVLGCMAANGNTHEAMVKCSCSIDFIAKRVPFSEYERAETALSMQAGGGLGGRIGLFKDPPEIKQAIDRLHQAQAEANLQCFE